MEVTVTFKLTPENEKEAHTTLAKDYKKFRETMEAGAMTGLFGPFDKTELRWLLESLPEKSAKS